VTGALLMGWYLAGVLNVLGDLHYPTQRARALFAGIAFACALVLVVAALVVEKWCQLPPVDAEKVPRGVTAPPVSA
jgi:polyferredoxin